MDAWSEDSADRNVLAESGQPNKEDNSCWKKESDECEALEECVFDAKSGECYELQCWDITDKVTCGRLENCVVLSDEEMDAMKAVEASLDTFPDDAGGTSYEYAPPVCEPLMYQFDGIEGMATSCFNIKSEDNCNREMLDDGETQQCTRKA